MTALKYIFRAAMLLACLAGPLAAEDKLVEDQPIATKPSADGVITGKIVCEGGVEAVMAVSRDTGKTYQSKSFDKTSGEFTFTGLEGDAVYDIAVRTADGREVEGIDLSFVDARMARLAELRRKDLGMAARPATDFTAADKEQIVKYVRDLDDFMDNRRVLLIKGDGPRATALVELLRTREFYSSKQNEIIWRIELWYFENRTGGWERVSNQERVLRHERISAEKLAKIRLEYYPQLSVYVDAQGKSPRVEFTVPRTSEPTTQPAIGKNLR